MNMMQAVQTVFSKYATFSGRARRAEFWWFVLFYMIVNLVLSIVDSFLFGTTTTTENGFSASTDTPILSGIFALGSLIPNLAVGVRRLHDINRRGWWLLIALSGYREEVDDRVWARKLFGFSIIAITALSLMMSIDFRAVPTPLLFTGL